MPSFNILRTIYRMKLVLRSLSPQYLLFYDWPISFGGKNDFQNTIERDTRDEKNSYSEPHHETSDRLMHRIEDLNLLMEIVK